jgi:hypothetical protein
MTTDRERRNTIHDWLDRIFQELGPGEDPFSVGVGIECGDEWLLFSIVDGDTAVRRAVLTDPEAVRRAFDAGTADLASGDVTT